MGTAIAPLVISSASALAGVSLTLFANEARSRRTEFSEQRLVAATNFAKCCYRLADIYSALGPVAKRLDAGSRRDLLDSGGTAELQTLAAQEAKEREKIAASYFLVRVLCPQTVSEVADQAALLLNQMRNDPIGESPAEDRDRWLAVSAQYISVVKQELHRKS